jgi:hypothetical protein
MFLPLTAQKGEILKNVSMMAFLDMDMKHKIIHSINMPELDENYHLRTFKVTYLITIGMLSYKTGCSCLSCTLISDTHRPCFLCFVWFLEKLTFFPGVEIEFIYIIWKKSAFRGLY